MSKNLCKDLVIYDLDGTLVDSAVTVTTVLNVLRRNQSKPFVCRACPAIDVIGWSRVDKTNYGMRRSRGDAYLNEFRRLYAETEICPNTLFPQVTEVLERLKIAGCRLRSAPINRETWLKNVGRSGDLRSF